MILSEKNISKILSTSVPSRSVKKILDSNSIRETTGYIPINSLWITKLFIRLANESENTFLTLDYTGFHFIQKDQVALGQRLKIQIHKPVALM